MFGYLQITQKVFSPEELGSSPDQQQCFVGTVLDGRSLSKHFHGSSHNSQEDSSSLHSMCPLLV